MATVTTPQQQSGPSQGPQLRRLPLATRADAFFENLFLGAVSLATFIASLFVVGKVATSGWAWVGFIAFWVALGYAFLPRLQRVLTAIYVPSYFLARTRTGDGLLGDPVNLALTGSPEQLHSAMQRAGWTLADPINARSAAKVVGAVALRRPYSAAPVSALLLFDRAEDFAYEHELTDNGSRRHHVRFWRCPDDFELPGGQHADWLAAASMDRRIGLSSYTLHITHKIDKHIDRERDHVLHSIERVEPSTEVSVLRAFSSRYHDRNGGGDPVETDGNLPIVRLDDVAPDPDTHIPESTEAGGDIDPGRRPVNMLAGLILAITSVVLLALFALFVVGAQDLSAVTGADATTAGHLLLGFRIAVAVVGAAALVCAVLAYLGSHRARWALLAAATAAVAILVTYAFVALHVGFLIPLSVAVLLTTIHTLTSRTARDWTTSGQAKRR